MPRDICQDPKSISIHAPLAGSDRLALMSSQLTFNFNPRSPCGERPTSAGVRAGHQAFQSTLPLRGATSVDRGWCDRLIISIHAPLAGSDQFQTTVRVLVSISIHAPLAGSDPSGHKALSRWQISIHAPLAGSDGQGRRETQVRGISIHAPLAGSDTAP